MLFFNIKILPSWHLNIITSNPSRMPPKVSFLQPVYFLNRCILYSLSESTVQSRKTGQKKMISNIFSQWKTGLPKKFDFMKGENSCIWFIINLSQISKSKQTAQLQPIKVENIKQAVKLLNFPTDTACQKKNSRKSTQARHMNIGPSHIRKGEGIIADQRENPVKVTFLGIRMKASRAVSSSYY